MESGEVDAPLCLCGNKAKFAITRGGKNKGRSYYACCCQSCDYFKWADGQDEDKKESKKRIPPRLGFVSASSLLPEKRSKTSEPDNAMKSFLGGPVHRPRPPPPPPYPARGPDDLEPLGPEEKFRNWTANERGLLDHLIVAVKEVSAAVRELHEIRDEIAPPKIIPESREVSAYEDLTEHEVH